MVTPSNADKIQRVLEGLGAGKDRDVIASELGYKNYRSLDVFMRRQGYSWDRRNLIYVLPGEKADTGAKYSGPLPPGKAGRVIAQFSIGKLDARGIAKKLGFESHRDMAAYMESRGYYWDSELGNYVSGGGDGQRQQPAPQEPRPAGAGDRGIAAAASQATGAEVGALGRYLPLLEFLAEKEQDLREMLGEKPGRPADGSFPRYGIPGRSVTKSVYMSNQLDELIRMFSEEKGIHQREIFEIALVDFFRKYGFEREIQSIMGRN